MAVGVAACVAAAVPLPVGLRVIVSVSVRVGVGVAVGAEKLGCKPRLLLRQPPCGLPWRGPCPRPAGPVPVQARLARVGFPGPLACLPGLQSQRAPQVLVHASLSEGEASQPLVLRQGCSWEGCCLQQAAAPGDQATLPSALQGAPYLSQGDWRHRVVPVVRHSRNVCRRGCAPGSLFLSAAALPREDQRPPSLRGPQKLPRGALERQ